MCILFARCCDAQQWEIIGMEDYYQLIRLQYIDTAVDSTELFRYVLSVAERCIIYQFKSFFRESIQNFDLKGTMKN